MISLTLTRSGVAALGRRQMQEVGRGAIETAARYWFEKYLPLHFTNVAYLRYRFASRSKRTNELKRDQQAWPFGENTGKAIGEVAPLVFTGRTREKVDPKHGASPNIVAKAKNFETYHADVILDAPVLNFSVNKKIDLRDEITRFTPQEEITLGNVFGEDFIKRLEAKGVTETQTKRVA